MNGPVVHVVLTCAQGKRQASHADLQARKLPDGGVRRRVGSWVRKIEHIEHGHEGGIKAQDLYSGEHWGVAKRLIDRESSGGIKVWILSAGYGLVRPKDRLRSYQATFGLDKEDAVVQRPEELSDWWAGLAKSEPPGVGNHARQLSSIQMKREGDILLVAASRPYLRAVSADLVRFERKRPGQLLVISAGMKGNEPTPGQLLPVGGRLRTHLGGSMMSLNVRVAEALIEQQQGQPMTFESCKRALARLNQKAEDLPSFDRVPLSDEEVLQFVRTELDRITDATWSAMLRTLRSQGRACEQKRFRRLALSLIQEEAHG